MAYFGWLAIFLIILVIILTLLHWVNTDFYIKNLINIRKTSYSIVIIIYFCMILGGYVLLNDWASTIQYMSIAIFIDLAIIETPSILKIGNAELKRNDQEFEGLLAKTKKTIVELHNKSNQFNDVVTYAPQHFSDWTDHDYINLSMPQKYCISLEKYLQCYTKKFNFEIAIFPVIRDQDKDKEKINIINTVNQLATEISIEIHPTEEIIKELSDARVSIIAESKVALIPFFEFDPDIILLIIATKNFDLSAIDITHILNLIRVFKWFSND